MTSGPASAIDRPRRGRPRARNEILRANRLGGHEPETLAASFGTPLYVYDLDVVGRQVEALRSVLPARFELAYAIKANPSLGVVAHLAGSGLGADVASGGELATALRAGVPAIVVPFTMDQPFWASRVVALGAGPTPIARKRLTLGRLADALRTTVADTAMRARSAALGEKLRAEDGVAEAVAHFGRMA